MDLESGSTDVLGYSYEDCRRRGGSQGSGVGRADRTEVAARLLDSLEQAEDVEADAAWTAEFERRAVEMESGAVRGVSWEELRERLLHGRRAS